MGGRIRYTLWVLTLVAGVARVNAQPQLSSSDVLRVQDAVAAAFDFLYTLPRDTAGAEMGTWVVDTAATTTPTDSVDRWRIVVAKLSDTGDALQRAEMTGREATSPGELAAAMAEMQRLEAKISKAEAEASLEIEISVNRTTRPGPSETHLGAKLEGVVSDARLSTLYRGYWSKVDDRELGMTVERWVPGQLLVHFASEAPRALESLDLRAEGSEELLDRLVREARWERLSALFP